MVMAGVCVYLTLNSDDDRDSLFGPDMFKGYYAELGNSVSLGIINDYSLNAAVGHPGALKMSVLGDDGDQGEKKNRLVGIDEEGNMFEVVFKKIEVADDGRPNVVMQDDFEAQIDKLYITKDFIYFNIVTHETSRQSYSYNNFSFEYYSKNYDQRDYISNGIDSESFVISRQNNHVYSLAAMPQIGYIEDDILVWGYRASAYQLSVEGDQLILTNLVPNVNIWVQQIMVNEDGIILIRNDTRNEIVGNIVYFTAPDDYRSNRDEYYEMVKGNNGKVYMGYGEQMFDTGTMSWIVPDPSEYVTIPAPSYYTIIKNNEVYTVQYEYLVCYYRAGTVDLEWPGFKLDYQDYKAVCLVGEAVLCLDAGQVYVYYTASGEGRTKVNLGIESIQRIEMQKGTLVAFAERIGGTVTYEIYMDENGVVSYEQIDEIVYDGKVIVIKPLTV
ncbi:MAG: hypothetical protein LBV13_05300 [Methanomassiliicoccaceae archaeon]|jgi:hypothetical protein|nr:hypothetical protein [Methanomassiliicoccaceae archaeon]